MYVIECSRGRVPTTRLVHAEGACTCLIAHPVVDWKDDYVDRLMHVVLRTTVRFRSSTLLRTRHLAAFKVYVSSVYIAHRRTWPFSNGRLDGSWLSVEYVATT